MREYDEMVKNLPSAYRGDAWVLALLTAIAGEDDRQRAEMDETAAQLLADSLTWLLGKEEDEAGLTPAAGATLEERRSALVAKWRAGSGKVDLAYIRVVCDSWKQGEVEVTYKDRTLTLRFQNIYGVPTAIDTLKTMVREAAPAHIPMTFVLRFRMWSELESRTWGELEGAAWGDLLEGEI